MKKIKVAFIVSLFLVAGAGAITLAKPPGGGGGGGGTQNCNRVVCAQCPEGFFLQKGVWPDCCVCVPAP